MTDAKAAVCLLAVATACSGNELGEVDDPAPASETAAVPGLDEAVPAPPEAPAQATVEAALTAWEAWERAYSAGASEAIVSRYAEDAVLMLGDVEISGASRIARYHELVAAGIPDLDREVIGVLARRGEVVVLASAHGVQSGEVMGAPASGAPVGRTELTRFVIDATGLIRRHEHYADALNLAGQLGARELDHRDAALVGTEPAGRYTQRGGEASLEILEALFEALDAGDGERAAALFADDGVLVDASAAADARGPREIRGHLDALRAAFPDLAHRDRETWAAGPLAIATYTLEGGHGGTWNRLGLRATGSRFSVPAALLSELEDSMVARAWWLYDGLAIAGALEPDADD